MLCKFEKPIPPCNILTGWYDFFLEGALEDYQKSKAQQRNVHLTVGPFAHWGVIGFMPLYAKTMLDCFDAHLLQRQPLKDIAPVRLYVLGLGWQYYAEYPPLTVAKIFMLGRDFDLLNQVDDVATQLQHRYFYDPATPTPSLGGPTFNLLNSGARDQSSIEARKDVLVYTSMPQKVAAIFVGPVRLHLVASFSTASADFIGRLCHVDKQGVSTNLCEGLTTMNQSDSEASLVEVQVAMGATAVLLQPGERIRLQICSAAHPRWFRNCGTGEKLRDVKKFCAGHVEIHTGELVLPMEKMATSASQGQLQAKL